MTVDVGTEARGGFDVERRCGAARRRAVRLLLASMLGLCAAGAAAERAQDNAVTAAEDAFGLAVGNQAIGLYSMTDARGFSPQQAGNLRIEGLYFDNPSNYVGPCTARATRMRIGLTAQPYSFPSPTGIADLKLQAPGERAGLSAVLSRGPYQAVSALVEGQAPVSDALAGSLCAGYDKDFTPDQARQSENLSAGAVLRFHPSARTEIVPFWSFMNGGQHAMLPVVFTDGLEPPPLFDAGRLAAQPFTSYGWRTSTVGVIVRQSFGNDWSLAAGLFRASEQDRLSYVEEYLLASDRYCATVTPAVLPGRCVDHLLDVLPALTSTSTSGELRLVRHFGSGVHERKVDVSVRGRSSDRAYGGDVPTDYGPASLDGGAPAAVPINFPNAGASIDETRQIDIGAVYEERWKGVGSLGVGLLKSHYRRTIRTPTAAPESSLATPWLANLRFTVDPSAAVTLYGSYLQGLEDSALAPYWAMNDLQPPPATRTRQVDGGLRYAPADKLSLVFGAFEIQKVYFNVDATTLDYKALGTVRHRGLESSLAYGANGLTVIAGGVWLRPHVERAIEEPGATGLVPLGPVPLTLTLNLDYAPARWRPLAAAVQLSRLSARVSTLNNAQSLPPLSTVSAGLRYESKLHNHPFSVRLDAMNLTNAHGLHLSSVGQVTPEFGRRFMLTFSMDH
jgi:iron complex outermembrane receptor protein